MSIPSQEPKPLLALHTSCSNSKTHDHQDAGKPNIVLRTGSAAPNSINKLEEQMKKSSFKIKSASVKYMECLKNHAAAIGGNATDGCGEFMAGGEEGTLEALKCSACNCHRNFHRKIHIQPAAEPSSSSQAGYPASGAFGPAPPIKNKSAVNYGAGTGTELGLAVGHQFTPNPVEGEVKKRFRTKFSQEQREKMHSFAEKAEWKLQKLDDSEVRRFCQEIGIKRKVLKVWMHNNKYNLAKRNSTTS